MHLAGLHGEDGKYDQGAKRKGDSKCCKQSDHLMLFHFWFRKMDSRGKRSAACKENPGAAFGLTRATCLSRPSIKDP